jgi:hypothetical protein
MDVPAQTVWSMPAATVQLGVEHMVVLTEEVFLVAVAGVIAPPPDEVLPMVLVDSVGLVVVNPDPVISLHPLLPFVSVLPKKTSLIPAPKLTVYPQKTNELPISRT